MELVVKNAQISSQILGLVTKGASLKEAFDQVLGAGKYDQLVNDLYLQLREKGAR